MFLNYLSLASAREVKRLEIEITVLLDFENCLIDVVEVQMN
jgi:hypothetical protein